MPETQYLIHNTTRGVETRFARRSAATPPRMTLNLGGGTVRVLRNRPQVVTEKVVRRLLGELKQKEEAGRLKVTTLQGLRVDLNTFKVVENPPVTPPFPHPPLDSAQNDKNLGVGDVKIHHGDPKGLPQNAEVSPPVIGGAAVPEGMAPEPPPEPIGEPEAVAEELKVPEALTAQDTAQEDPVPTPPSTSNTSRKKPRGRR